MPPKIAMVGAGSHVFARRLLSDLLSWPSLREATITLMDLDAERLELMAALARKMGRQVAAQYGAGPTIEATTDLRQALADADYVTVSIRVGESRAHITIPLAYGINQAVGDTTGPGGVFYFLKNGPAILEIARAMEQLCPHALMLNYTNPMVMLCWAIQKSASIRYVGLCHSVQGTAAHLAEYIGAPFEEVSYWAAGINHMAWFLEYRWQGRDAYPLLWQAMQRPEIYEQDIVKWELMKYFGAFVSESSIHASEYLPYFRRTPELIDRHTSERMWGVPRKGLSPEERWVINMARRAEQDAELQRLAASDAPLPLDRSNEYCSHILNAIETNVPYVFNGNVQNTGLITNLPQGAIVEVPIMADNCGLHPCYVGELPPALAALNRSSLAVQELAVRGLLERNREFIYQAVQLDPLTASLLPLADIRRMVDEMFAADAAYITI